MSDNTATLLLVGGGAAALYWMYTKKVGLFAPSSSSSVAPLAPITGQSMIPSSTTPVNGTQQNYGGTPATVPSQTISANPDYYQLPTYTTPIVAPTADGAVINWQGVNTYAAQLQVVLNGKGMATASAYQGIYQCMANVSNGAAMSADQWGVILQRCIGGSSAPAGVLVTGSYDSTPMTLNSYWRFISPYGVPVASIAGLRGLGRMPRRSAFAV